MYLGRGDRNEGTGGKRDRGEKGTERNRKAEGQGGGGRERTSADPDLK